MNRWNLCKDLPKPELQLSPCGLNPKQPSVQIHYRSLKALIPQQYLHLGLFTSMAKRKKNQKIRTNFKHGYESRTRKNDLTRQFDETQFSEDDVQFKERVSGKGDLAKKRTIRGQEVQTETGTDFLLEIDEENCLPGQVLSVHGLNSFVEDKQGYIYQCATRKLLKTLSTDQRHIVVAGDQVQFRPVQTGGAKENDSQTSSSPPTHFREGLIVRVEPRFGTISRTSRNRQHVIATNIDQIIIVSSAAMPDLKPHLIDRLLLTAEKSRIRPIICINKVDLVDPALLQAVVGLYAQLGYDVWLISVVTGLNLNRLRTLMTNKRTVVVGQSGVGKSSLLNAIQPELGLRVGHVSSENQKGRHTTTSAQLLKLDFGGYIVDTPGIRQFELWDVIAEEVAGFFPELRPFSQKCRFPNCTHTHEIECRVKDAVADGDLDLRRYESFRQICDDAATGS